MKKASTGKICTSGNYLFCKRLNICRISIKKMIPYILFKVLFAVFKEKIKIVTGLFDIKKFDYIFVL